MNVYIDCGAYNGDTADCNNLFEFDADYKIAYEANPLLYSKIPKFAYNEIHNKAVWIKNTNTIFYVDQSETPMGSTLMFSKKTGKLTPINIKTVDLAHILEKYKDENVLVKMDIEGAEFLVLEHLIRTGTDKYIDTLYVETHENKVPEYTGTYKNDLISRLNCGEIYLWH